MPRIDVTNIPAETVGRNDSLGNTITPIPCLKLRLDSCQATGSHYADVSQCFRVLSTSYPYHVFRAMFGGIRTLAGSGIYKDGSFAVMAYSR